MAKKASSPRDSGKEAPSCIAFDCTIRVYPERSAPPVCFLVYGAWHLKVMPLSLHYVYKVSSICLKARLSLL